MNRRVPIVLLIESEAIQSRTLARALKDGGYSVIPARRADDALETFATHHMDIALVAADTQSATSAGRSMLAALRAIDPWVPVVAMSTAATIDDEHTDEHPNVAATLTKPVAPNDLIPQIQRVLQSTGWQDLPSHSPTRDKGLDPDGHLVTPGTTPTLHDWADDLGSASFCWPPTEADLDDIQVVDTQSGRPWLSELRARLAHAPAPLTASAQLVAPVKLDARVQATLATRSAPPVQLAVRQFDNRRVKRRFEFRTDRRFAVAATALCGLSLTTLLALGGVSVKRVAIADTAPAAVSPILTAHDHVATMPLVAAERIISRFDSRTSLATRVNPTSPATVTPLASRQREPISDVTAMDTRTRDAVALPGLLVAARPPAPPAPHVEVAERIEPTATRAAAASSNVRAPAVDRARDDERGIYQVLQQYERAYERLDVDAARAVFPSLNTRALARAFDGLKEQALEFSHCRVALESGEATAVCGGRASYVPRVGPQTARTEPREWTFRLRKIDHDWLIAKAEVR